MQQFQAAGYNQNNTNNQITNQTYPRGIRNQKKRFKTFQRRYFQHRLNQCNRDRCQIKKNLQPSNYSTNNGVQHNKGTEFKFEVPTLPKDLLQQDNQQQQQIQVQNCVLNPNKIPRHVAIILDGNSRWARQRGRSVMEGHRAGCDALLQTIQNCLQLNNDIVQYQDNVGHVGNGLNVLTVFAFSLENLQRPQQEVQFIFQLFNQVLDHEMRKLEQQGVRIRVFGDQSFCPVSLQRSISRAQERTKNNSALILNVGFGYGARQDIVAAAKKLAKQAQEGLINADEIDEYLFKQNLSFGENELGAPDLLVRTSGEKRVSNFLLWECAYSEMMFIEDYWPDFKQQHLYQCVHEFGQRNRRFGKRSCQQ